MADVVHEFNKSLTLGDWAEEAVLSYLQSKAGVLEIRDVRRDAFYRAEDVDFILVRLNREDKIEVKGDAHTTNRVYLEWVSSLNEGSDTEGTLGCIRKTRAHFLFYYFVKQGRMLIIPVEPLQDWLARRRERLTAKYIVNRLGRRTLRSLGYTVPVSVLRAQVPGIIEVVGLPRKHEPND